MKLGYWKGGLLAAGAISGAMCLALSLAVIIDDHRKSFTSHLEILKTELRKVKADYEDMKEDFEKGVSERMAARH